MTKLYNQLPAELNETLDSIEYKEDGEIQINAVTRIKSDMQVNFTIYFGSSDIPQQNWSMLIKKIKAQWIVFEWSADYFEFYSEHSLLYDYTDNSVELYFRNTSYNPEKLFVDVFTIDQTLFDGKRRFGTYLNTANGLYGLCKQSHGLFARGPQRVIEHYAKCLAKHGMETSIIMQNEQEFQIENGLVLLLVGESYFIGQDFIFTRLH